MRGITISRTLWTLAPLVVAGALLSPPLYGQDEAPEQPRECACAFDFEMPGARHFLRFNRAQLGVTLGASRDVDGRRGVAIDRVLEGGPAARAGLRAGDVLLSLDGKELGEDPTGSLLDIIAGVEPQDTVEIEYSREGRRNTARVVADRANGAVFRRVPGPDGLLRTWRRDAIRPMMEARLRPGENGLVFRHHREGLQLADMNAGLGIYFGTTEGVLVTEVTEESALGLQPGDVILSVGGREVRDPAHVRQILGSYRPDESIRMEVIRQGQRTTITGTRR